jgi:hypothetical protein
MGDTAMAHELGKFLVRYEGRGVIGPFLAFVAALGVTGASIWSYTDPSAPTWLKPMWIAGGMFLFVAGGAVITGLRSYEVDIHEKGFVYSTTSEIANVYWDDVTAVWQAKRTRERNGPTTHASYKVLLKNGKKLTIDSELFKDPEGLGDGIQKQVTRCLMPKYVELLRSGGTAKFGKLSINHHGISNDQEIIPWSQVRDIRINLGYININKDGKWLTWSSVRAANIPNLYVFLGLVDQIVEIKS